MKLSLAITGLLATLAVGCGAAHESSNGESSVAENGPITCAIQTNDGHYLSAVGGGGRINDVIHSDATKIGAWEKFTLVDAGLGTPNITYGIRTVNGHYLTAVGGGGRISDVIHSDATQIKGWEQFQMISLTGGEYAISTQNGRYLTATGGGGNIRDVIHSDATMVRAWERFRLKCGIR